MGLQTDVWITAFFGFSLLVAVSLVVVVLARVRVVIGADGVESPPASHFLACAMVGDRIDRDQRTRKLSFWVMGLPSGDRGGATGPIAGPRHPCTTVVRVGLVPWPGARDVEVRG